MADTPTRKISLRNPKTGKKIVWKQKVSTITIRKDKSKSWADFEEYLKGRYEKDTTWKPYLSRAKRIYKDILSGKDVMAFKEKYGEEFNLKGLYEALKIFQSDKIKEILPSQNIINQLQNVAVILAQFFGSPRIEEDFKQLFNVSRQKIAKTDNSQMTERQEKWAEKANLKEWRKEIENDVDDIDDVKLAKALYVYLPPQRLEAFAQTSIWPNIDGLKVDKLNYIDLENGVLVLNKTKTGKNNTIDIPEPLLKIIKAHYNKGNMFLFTKTPNNLSKFFLKYVGVGSQGLRTAKASTEDAEKPISELEQIAKDYNHSVDTHLKYYVKKRKAKRPVLFSMK